MPVNPQLLWWPPVIRGAFAILFGVLAVIWPGITLLALVVLFGAYSLIDGITAIGSAVTGRRADGSSRIMLGVMGVFGVAAGLVALFWPHITAIALAWLIAFWALFTGILEVSASFRLRGATGAFPWLMFLSGLLSVALGVVIAFMPGRGALGLIWAIGVLAIIEGVVLIALGLYIRHDAKRFETAVEDAAHHPPAPPAPA
ncbi:HdeD family acid-resistance protein [Flindersiella endophytica]